MFRKLLILVLLVILAGAVYVYGARQGWFGEGEKGRIEEGEQKLQESIRRGEERLEDLQDEVRERIGD